MTRFRPTPPLVVGLIGGIASGKTAVAGIFAEFGLEHIDADREARAAAERAEVRAAIRARFGDGVFSATGALDRPALARLVFSDAGARADLEAITHPAIRAAILRRIDAALDAGRSVLLDVPLLLEGGLWERCDAVVFVDAPEAARVRRAASRGWDAAELRRRERSQLSLAVKKARATATIDNSDSLTRTRDRIDALLTSWAASRPVRG